MDCDKNWDLENSIDTDSASSSIQSWSFSLPFSGLPQFPVNPIAQLSLNLDGIRGYFPTNLNLPIFTSGVTSIPMPSSMIPSFISRPDGESLLESWSITMPSIPSIPSMVSSALNSVSFQETGRKDWAQLRDSAQKTQRKLAEIGGKIPCNFNFVSISDEQGNKIGTRIYACFAASGSTTSLYYCDIMESTSLTKGCKKTSKKKDLSNPKESITPRQSLPKASFIQDSIKSDDSQNPSSPNSVQQDDESRSKPIKSAIDFDWKPLIDPNAKIHSPKNKDSCNRTQEKLQLERKRITLPGITEYQFHKPSRRFLFNSCGNLFYFDDIGIPPYIPNRLKSSTKSEKINPTICPANPDLIAYQFDNDLWVVNLENEQKLSLTQTRTSDGQFLLSAGLPSYVIQEEFSRFNGFWWRPGSTRISENVREYDILYEEIDETEVEVIHLLNSNGEIDDYRYPRAGGNNATSIIKLASFKYDKTTGQLYDAHIQAITPLQSLYSNYEYLVRCDWYSRDCVWVQLLNRQQKHLVLGLFSLNNLFPPQVLLQETSSYWINVHDVLHFIKTKKRTRRSSLSTSRFSKNLDDKMDDLKPGSHVKFIWISQNSGFRHLCHVKVQLVDKEDGTAKTNSTPIKTTSPPHRRSHGGPNNQDAGQQYEQDDNDASTTSPKLPQYQANLLEKTFLTSGEWEVDGKEIWVDENNHLVYFIATKDTPLEQHLYCVSFKDEKYEQNCNNSSRKIVKLSESGFSHTTVAFNSDCDLFIDIQSSISYAPFGFVFKKLDLSSSYHETSSLSAKRPSKYSSLDNINGSSSFNTGSDPCFKRLGLIVNNCVQQAARNLTMGSSSPSTVQVEIDSIPGIIKPELFKYQLKSGDTVYGLIFKPEFMDQGVKYPCVLDIYGGPETQIVTNSFRSVRHSRYHLLATEGYVVIAVDCRGSGNRGMKFESHIHLRIGQVEIMDQIEVLTWLAENLEYIDMSRVAINGWSYGGFLALMGLAQRPNIFRVAIAGAPVTNWLLYDTGYTERYLDSPYKNPAGYAKGNVLNYVNSFPDEENRLLLVHGLMDENVHFIHTQQLIQALVKQGKPYTLQVYPSERHSIKSPPSFDYNETLLISFLEQHLKPYRNS